MTGTRGWETVSAYQMRKRLKQARDRYEELDPKKEVHYREYEDPATHELVIRVIPHTGVTPHG